MSTCAPSRSRVPVPVLVALMVVHAAIYTHAQGTATPLARAAATLDADAAHARTRAAVGAFLDGDHTNNWAILVCASRFYFNYRHIANVLSMYHMIKAQGIPDHHIILMLADDVACSPRNVFPAQVFNEPSHATNLYGAHVEVDYRGYDVSVEQLLRILTGRHERAVPRAKRLMSDARSNVLLYLTGHGGDRFLKFQDTEEIASSELAHAIADMHEKGRYHELLLVTDTCQAGTLGHELYSPHVVSIGSSRLGENSYARENDYALGVSLVDRFTYRTLQLVDDMPTRTTSLADLFGAYEYADLRSHVEVRADLYGRPLSRVPLSHFFSSQVRPRPVAAPYPIAAWES